MLPTMKRYKRQAAISMWLKVHLPVMDTQELSMQFVVILALDVKIFVDTLITSSIYGIGSM